MLPALAAFPAAFFYEGRLQTGVRGCERRVGTSYENPGEAEVVAGHVDELLRTESVESLAVIAPYAAQRNLLERRLAELGVQHPKLQVATVDALQGDERDVVIFSATRSNDVGVLGFLSDPRRANVLLTRARRGLCVVGDARTLRCDPTWGAWLAALPESSTRGAVKARSREGQEGLKEAFGESSGPWFPAQMCIGNLDEAIADCDQVMIRERACNLEVQEQQVCDTDNGVRSDSIATAIVLAGCHVETYQAPCLSEQHHSAATGSDSLRKVAPLTLTLVGVLGPGYLQHRTVEHDQVQVRLKSLEQALFKMRHRNFRNATPKTTTDEYSEIKDVQALKRHLQGLCGLPRFRQRVLHQGTELKDDAKLESFTEVQLVALNCFSPSEQETLDFANAIRLSQVSEVERYLQLPLDPDHQTRPGEQTPLSLAAGLWGNVEVTSLLLEARANVNIPDEDGATALIWACEDGFLDTARLLLEARADVRATDVDGCQPLGQAAGQGHLEVVRLLLTARAEINCVPEAEEACPGAALHHACSEGHVEIAQFLLQARAAASLPDVVGQTPLHDAAKSGDEEMVGVLLSAAASVDVADELGDTALIVASASGFSRTVHLLLEARADRNLADWVGATALHFATAEGYQEVVSLLLLGGENPIPDSYGTTALHWAAHYGHTEVAKLLLHAGMDLHAVDNEGKTAFLEAACSGYSRTVRLLFEAKSDQDAADNLGRTALHWASMLGDQETLCMLLRARANVNVVDKQSTTALHLACFKGHMQVAQYLLLARADKDQADNAGSTSLIMSSRQGYFNTTRLLLAAGAQRDLTDKEGGSALQWAAYRGHEGIACLLLEALANPCLPDGGGRQALHYAADRRHRRVAIQLLQAGAGRDLTDEGAVEIAEMLLESGAELDLARILGIPGAEPG
ncbi:ANKRD50 [Symbiodinium natans]|uniref:ANKRD50 protein n=1 Tax=Symbiodinium natans TaxID=878477 RepID=A0A812QAF2_9DINO|nr:ANKRD50 [Symbiodinium natans]